MSPTQDLYTTADVKRVREFLFSEQEGYDACTGLDLPPEKACLDHDHTSQLVRGVLHRNVNALIGVLENNYKRHLNSWYPYDLPSFLRLAADYLEKEDDLRWFHPSWIKRLTTDFNALKEGDKKALLSEMGASSGINLTERKKLFKEVIISKKYTFKEAEAIIEKYRKNN